MIEVIEQTIDRAKLDHDLIVPITSLISMYTLGLKALTGAKLMLGCGLGAGSELLLIMNEIT